MPLINEFALDIDLKNSNYISEVVVTSNDSVRFVANLTDDGIPVNLSDMTMVTISHKRHDGVVVLKGGTKTGASQVTFDFGSTEISVPGRVESKIQVYSADDRVSTFSFDYLVVHDPSTAYIPSEDDQTLIQQVLGEAPQLLLEAQEAIDTINEIIEGGGAVGSQSKTTVNVTTAFKASGSAETTTGSVVGTALTLSQAKDFKDGQGISIYRAGADVSLIPAPSVAPAVYQVSGSSSWTAGSVIHVAYSLYGRDETSPSPSTAVTISANNNEIRFKIDLPFATRRIGIYCGTNPAALKRIGWIRVDGGVDITDGGGSGIEALLVFPHDKPQVPFVARVRRVAAGGGSNPVVAATVRSDFGSIGLPMYGTPGSTRYDYYVVALSPRGGVTRADATGYRDDGNAVLSNTNYLKVEWPMVNTMAFAVYGKSTNPAPSRGLLAIVVGRTYFEDKGQGPLVGTLPPHIPSLPPTSGALREIFTTKIASGGGTTSIVLEDAVNFNITNTAVYHDDTAAFQEALEYLRDVNGGFGTGGGTIKIDAGTYYISGTLFMDVVFDWNSDIILSGTSRNSLMKLLPGCNIVMLGQSIGTDTEVAVFGCTIEHLEFDGNTENHTYGTCCSVNAAEWKIHDVKTRFFYDGWMMRGSTYSGGGINGAIVMDTCFISDCIHIGVVMAIDGLIMNSYIGGCGKDRCWDSIGCGAYLPAWANIVSGNKFWDNRTHIILNGAGCVINDNVFEASTEHMILLVGVAYRNLISNNRLNPNIYDSEIYDIIRFQQIFGGESGQMNKISGNFCQPALGGEHPYRYLVYEYGNCDKNMITDNYLLNALSETYPFHIVGANTAIYGNYY